MAVAMKPLCPVCGKTSLAERYPHDVSFVEEVSTEEVLALAMQLFTPRARRTSARERACGAGRPRPALHPVPRPPDEALH